MVLNARNSLSDFCETWYKNSLFSQKNLNEDGKQEIRNYLGTAFAYLHEISYAWPREYQAIVVTAK